MGMDFLVVAFVLATLMMVIVMAVGTRLQREKHRVDLQKAILERVGSVKDLAEFLASEQGERFLASLSPAHFGVRHRLLSVRVGVVLLTIGVFMMVALHSNFFGSFGDTPPPPLLMATLLLVAAGIGMLLSALVAFVIARGLGMFDRRSGGTGKGDAG